MESHHLLLSLFRLFVPWVCLLVGKKVWLLICHDCSIVVEILSCCGVVLGMIFDECEEFGEVLRGIRKGMGSKKGNLLKGYVRIHGSWNGVVWIFSWLLFSVF